jgi:hypothetical protein
LIGVIWQTLNKIIRSEAYFNHNKDSEYETELKTFLLNAFSLISNKRIKCKFVYTDEELNILKRFKAIDDNCFLITK